MTALRIADRWFQRCTFDDQVTLLWEPHVHPLLRCNIWHVRGRARDLLVDTGTGVASLADEMRDLIDKPLIAVATHIHYDHTGSLHEFADRAMHAIEAPRLAAYEEFASLRADDFPNGLLEDYSIAPGLAALLIDAAPHARFEISDYRVPGATITRVLEEGDVLDLGNRRFEVLHLPGHSPGSIGLHEHATRTLFSGDAIYDGPLLDELPDSNVPDYLATMRRLRSLPVDQVHAGHEASFGQDRLIELVDAYLARRS